MLVQANALHIPLADGCCQMCITSPPYFGLRSYLPIGHADKALELGCEPSSETYIANLVAVFREVWRVLHNSGVVFLNLGDSYAGSGGAHTKDHANPGLSRSAERDGVPHYQVNGGRGPDKFGNNLKPKDLCMIPARVALALQVDGWWVRSDIIWAKKVCMPESVTDRPSRSYEHIFLLSKRVRYYYDADAIREPHQEVSLRRAKRRWGSDTNKWATIEDTQFGAPSWARRNDNPMNTCHPNGRNCRDVWLLGPQPYAGAHFATFPEELARRCILAGCPVGGLVLDPFVGSGTTVKVASDLGRRGVGLDLNGAYLELARQRAPLVMTQ